MFGMQSILSSEIQAFRFSEKYDVNLAENLILHDRTQLTDNPALYLLILSAFFIVLTKAKNSRTFVVTFNLFRSQLNFESNLKENWPLFGLNSWLLVFNFIINTAISLYFIFPLNGLFTGGYQILNSILFSLFFFGLAFFSMIFVNFISGSSRIYQTPFQVTWVLPQFIGIVMFCINLAWLLNPDFHQWYVWLFSAAIIVMSGQRFIRSSVFLLGCGIEWYYILLYLCTLEIIPLLLLVWFFFD